MMGNEQLPFGERVRLLVEESVELGMSPERFAGLVESYRLLYLHQKHDLEAMREMRCWCGTRGCVIPGEHEESQCHTIMAAVSLIQAQSYLDTWVAAQNALAGANIYSFSLAGGVNEKMPTSKVKIHTQRLGEGWEAHAFPRSEAVLLFHPDSAQMIKIQWADLAALVATMPTVQALFMAKAAPRETSVPDKGSQNPKD